jgi:hypothetical protein
MYSKNNQSTPASRIFTFIIEMHAKMILILIEKKDEKTNPPPPQSLSSTFSERVHSFKTQFMYSKNNQSAPASRIVTFIISIEMHAKMILILIEKKDEKKSLPPSLSSTFSERANSFKTQFM